MNSIVLHGSLKEQFGGPFNWSVQTPKEAVRALCVNKPGFEEALAQMDVRVVRVRNGRKLGVNDVSELGISMSETELHIIPAVAGAGDDGVGKTIAGIVLIVVGYFTLPYGGAYLIDAGIALILGGVAQMLAPQPPKPDPNDREDERASFLFSSVVNVTEQGHPVPLAYGRIKVGSVVISAGVSDEQIHIARGNGYAPVGPGAWPNSNVVLL